MNRRKFATKLLRKLQQHLRNNMEDILSEIEKEIPNYEVFAALVPSTLPESKVMDLPALTAYNIELVDIFDSVIEKQPNTLATTTIKLAETENSILGILQFANVCDVNKELNKDFIIDISRTANFIVPITMYQRYIRGEFLKKDQVKDDAFKAMMMNILLLQLNSMATPDKEPASTLSELYFKIQFYIMNKFLPDCFCDKSLLIPFEEFLEKNATPDVQDTFATLDALWGTAEMFSKILPGKLEKPSLQFKIDGAFKAYKEYCKKKKYDFDLTFDLLAASSAYVNTRVHESAQETIKFTVAGWARKVFTEAKTSALQSDSKINTLERNLKKKTIKIDKQIEEIKDLNDKITGLNKELKLAKQCEPTELENLKKENAKLRTQVGKYEARIQSLTTTKEETTQEPEVEQAEVQEPVAREEVEEQVPLDEIIEYLQQYKMAFVCGPSNIESVKEYLPNAKIISSKEKWGEIRIGQVDLVVIHTRVAGHARTVQAKKQGDRVGAKTILIQAPINNKEAMCRQIYKYVKPKTTTN